MKNVVFCAYAYDTNMLGSTNIASGNAAKGKDIYMKNIVVATVSAKRALTPPRKVETDVAIVTNISIEEPYASILKNNGVLIYTEPFDEFNLGSDYRWGLAFYKLCALKKMLSYGYDNYLLMDTDTYTFSDFSDLWDQTKDYLMLYDIGHRPTVPNCAKFYREAYEFAGIDRQITKYGGEFIAGNRQNMNAFIVEAENVFCQLKDKDFHTTGGDEFIINNVAYKMSGSIKNAANYIARYWTSPGFYRVATNHIYDPISIMHLPTEKQCGILVIYKYLIKKKKLPSVNKAFKILNVPRTPSKFQIVIYKIKRVLTMKFRT